MFHVKRLYFQQICRRPDIVAANLEPLAGECSNILLVRTPYSFEWRHFEWRARSNALVLNQAFHVKRAFLILGPENRVPRETAFLESDKSKGVAFHVKRSTLPWRLGVVAQADRAQSVVQRETV